MGNDSTSIHSADTQDTEVLDFPISLKQFYSAINSKKNPIAFHFCERVHASAQFTDSDSDATISNLVANSLGGLCRFHVKAGARFAMLPELDGGHFMIIPKSGSLYKKGDQIYTDKLNALQTISVVPATISFFLTVDNDVEALICWIEKPLLEQWCLTLNLANIPMDKIILDVKDKNLLQIIDVWESHFTSDTSSSPVNIIETIPHLLANFILSKYSKRVNDKSHLPPRGSDLVRKFEKYVKEHASSDITAQSVADHLQLPTAALAAHTKQVLGVTPSKFIKRVRLSLAHDLVKNTNMSLAEIAYATGYANQSHLTSIFKMNIGISPGGYRRSKDR